MENAILRTLITQKYNITLRLSTFCRHKLLFISILKRQKKT